MPQDHVTEENRDGWPREDLGAHHSYHHIFGPCNREGTCSVWPPEGWTKETLVEFAEI